MRRRGSVLVLLGLVAVTAGPTVAQGPGAPSSRPAKPGEGRPAAEPHRSGELECRNCHVGKHQGVVHMYVGMGGRGTPMIPSHMFQVRVECVACHVAPKEEQARAEMLGQTFRPTEQACVGCHGGKYRGMLARWSSTLARMQAIVAPKLAGARAAVAGGAREGPKAARARRLVDDAEFNTRFVALAKGVHNVFYAADLLKLANAWLDEAFVLLGAAPVKSDDTLVRGGYCGVLCHETAGVKLPESVIFDRRRIPHGRHVAEFGAVCTACHSAEVHKAVTATAATCAACHHSPRNERCESCHRAQSAFYRGSVETGLVKVEPNVMVDVVPCTGCHDFTRKHSRRAVGEKCLGCHEAPYMALLSEWTAGFDEDAGRAAAVLKRAEAALAGARRAKRPTAEADALVREAREALSLVRRARGAHNPAVADALLTAARRKAEEALARVALRRAG